MDFYPLARTSYATLAINIILSFYLLMVYNTMLTKEKYFLSKPITYKKCNYIFDIMPGNVSRPAGKNPPWITPGRTTGDGGDRVRSGRGLPPRRPEAIVARPVLTLLPSGS
jgi:hypothetical protein